MNGLLLISHAKMGLPILFFVPLLMCRELVFKIQLHNPSAYKDSHNPLRYRKNRRVYHLTCYLMIPSRKIVSPLSKHFS